jgi:hypothetical protein
VKGGEVCPDMTSSDQDTEILTPKQEQLIAVLVSGVNIATAARTIGIGDKTARRWLKLPHFLAGYKAAQQSIFDDRLAALREGVDTAINTLKRNMTSEDTPASVQVRAAQIWLEQAINLHKMSELEERLLEFEQYVKQSGR